MRELLLQLLPTNPNVRHMALDSFVHDQLFARQSHRIAIRFHESSARGGVLFRFPTAATGTSALGILLSLVASIQHLQQMGGHIIRGADLFNLVDHNRLASALMANRSEHPSIAVGHHSRDAVCVAFLQPQVSIHLAGVILQTVGNLRRRMIHTPNDGHKGDHAIVDSEQLHSALGRFQDLSNGQRKNALGLVLLGCPTTGGIGTEPSGTDCR